jgi:hypothetical protein
MDNLVSIYHGGTVERDRYGYVEFVDMQSVLKGLKNKKDRNLRQTRLYLAVNLKSLIPIDEYWPDLPRGNR